MQKKCQRCGNTFTVSKGNYMYCDDCRRLNIPPAPPDQEELTDNRGGQTRADISKMETVGAKNAHTEEVVVSKKEIATDEKVDIVSHPAHYTMGTIEPKDFIRDQGLNFNRGNVIKYTVRAGRKNKNKEVEDLKKAKQYLEFEIEYLEGQK